VVADVGCGYAAAFASTILDRAERLVLVARLTGPGPRRAPQGHGGSRVAAGTPLAAVADASQDVVVCKLRIEHLWEPMATLRELERMPRARMDASS